MIRDGISACTFSYNLINIKSNKIQPLCLNFIEDVQFSCEIRVRVKVREKPPSTKASLGFRPWVGTSFLGLGLGLVFRDWVMVRVRG